MNTRLFPFLALVLTIYASVPTAQPATLRSTLLDGLHASHDKAEWFVPLGIAVDGLTPEQANRFRRMPREG